jgi:hypothetical protein
LCGERIPEVSLLRFEFILRESLLPEAVENGSRPDEFVELCDARFDNLEGARRCERRIDMRQLQPRVELRLTFRLTLNKRRGLFQKTERDLLISLSRHDARQLDQHPDAFVR